MGTRCPSTPIGYGIYDLDMVDVPSRTEFDELGEAFDAWKVVVGSELASIRVEMAAAPPAPEAPPPPEPVPADTRPPLSWAPPVLDNPATVQAAAATADAGRRTLRLDTGRDYRVVLPADTPLGSALTIEGGRNVVLVGGEIRIPAGAPDAVRRRPLYLHGTRKTVHVEGLLISTDGVIEEGVDVDLRDASGIVDPESVVQIQNVRVERIRWDGGTHHPDLLQTWGGPMELRIDGFTGTTEYQGMFLHPQQYAGVPAPRRFTLRRVNITGVGTARYLLWL